MALITTFEVAQNGDIFSFRWFTYACNLFNTSLSYSLAYQHLSKSVECSRVHLFDIVTQYRAIFSDDLAHLDHHRDAVDLQSILQSWILHKVDAMKTDLLSSFNQPHNENLCYYLPTIEGLPVYDINVNMC